MCHMLGETLDFMVPHHSYLYNTQITTPPSTTVSEFRSDQSATINSINIHQILTVHRHIPVLCICIKNKHRLFQIQDIKRGTRMTCHTVCYPLVTWKIWEFYMLSGFCHSLQIVIPLNPVIFLLLGHIGLAKEILTRCNTPGTPS